MKFGICQLSTIPLRKDASHRSEMVSQLLFGEHYQLTKELENWCFIRQAYDQYEGWISKNQFFEISKKSYDKLEKSAPSVAQELAAPIEVRKPSAIFPVVLGSSLPNIPELPFEYGGESITRTKVKNRRAELIENAFMYLNSPYLWGGRSPFGIDCSGFTQVVHKLSHIGLPRDAAQQAKIGQSLSFIEEAEEGDLAFFDNEDGKITHVGIMLKNNQIIHASGKVRIDKIDHQGIFNNETRDYSHHLRLISKVIG